MSRDTRRSFTCAETFSPKSARWARWVVCRSTISRCIARPSLRTADAAAKGGGRARRRDGTGQVRAPLPPRPQHRQRPRVGKLGRPGRRHTAGCGYPPVATATAAVEADDHRRRPPPSTPPTVGRWLATPCPPASASGMVSMCTHHGQDALP
ncbi:hypothetical protein I4F81_008109 [Pyropia yezoensis]|uniref:Uncharacterized protein n=1 Tax=Pyropia yezoensis TaxID=2788 RepID=A0ACC3C6H1_PYRYE|nr:hypothetical protein I4F81_008109 [Neopyropia yezoensis]